MKPHSPSDVSTTQAWDCTPPHPPIRGDNALTVARWFGVAPGAWKPYRRRPSRRPKRAAPPLPRYALDTPAPGTITLVTGPSGAGKSTLLREWMHRQSVTRRFAEPCFSEVPTPSTVLRTVASQTDQADSRREKFLPETLAPAEGVRLLDLSTLAAPERPLVDLFPDLSLKQTLALLSRVGLAELWTYLRTPCELSDGQRWRLKLALAVHASRDGVPTVLLCDEFTALLDRVTAAVVAHGLRKLVDHHASNLSAILATSHDDLSIALDPDTTVFCDFTQVTIHHRQPEPSNPTRDTSLHTDFRTAHEADARAPHHAALDAHIDATCPSRSNASPETTPDPAGADRSRNTTPTGSPLDSRDAPPSSLSGAKDLSVVQGPSRWEQALMGKQVLRSAQG